jgi:omega-hydroxy-beta-dihydromenaquinone-9 sulfotransferase
VARHRFAIHRSRWKQAAIITTSSVVQSALRFVQQLLHGQQVAETPIRHAAVFILGHWRTGTTLLHELLTCDPRHAAPSTYDCFNPHHLLLTRSWLPTLLRRLVPVQRPMDSMAAGWDRPQEDEFALVLLGLPSPYERIAFPNDPLFEDALDPRALPLRTRLAWERTFCRFLRVLTLANGERRLIFKSPPHTARVATLLKLYPEAKFIHIVRDPYAIYASTLNLWRTFFTTHGLQPPSWEELPEYILKTFSRLHRAFANAQQLIPSGNLCELRYEELVRDPVASLEAAYRELALGDFEPARAPVQAYLSRVHGHESAKHLLTTEERRAVNDRWAAYFQQYGYTIQPG